MHSLTKVILALGMVSILTGPAVAQGWAGAGPGQVIGSIQSQLLDNPAVQKELKLDEEQVVKANALAAEIREKVKAVRPKIRGLAGDQAQAKITELVTPIYDDAMKWARSFLKPEQIKRFHQIDVQTAGLMAMNYPAITKKLGITEEQSARIRAIFLEYQAESRRLALEAGQDRQATFKSHTIRLALRKECLSRIISLLTDDQRKTWNELIGEPFDEANLTPAPAR